MGGRVDTPDGVRHPFAVVRRPILLLLPLFVVACGARTAGDELELRPLGGDAGAAGASGAGGATGTAGAGGAKSTFLDLDLGNSATCVLRTDATTRCWGLNTSGELGTGDLTASPAPAANLVSGASAISFGALHACAQVGPGATCWGKNDFGQLGRGTVTPFETTPGAPVVGAKVAQIAAGGQHTCFVDASGEVFCFGWNLDGQLGDGTKTDSSVPVKVVGLGGPAKKVSVGFVHSCALRVDGFVVCWGYGFEGQLGHGKKESSTTPVLVAGLAGGVVDVRVGGWHTCARKGDGSAWCWGNNHNGALGDATTIDRSSPVKIPLDGVLQVELDAGHTCARTVGDLLWCWGWNTDGQVGDGSKVDRVVPVKIAPLVGVTDVALGYRHSCAWTQPGGLWCWGSNDDGQLGNGVVGDALVPTPVPLP